MDFIHLHVHSEYSLLDGLTKIDDLVNKVSSLGMNAVALTDHGAMYGAFHFYLAAKEKGINPIIGLEAYKAKKSRLEKDANSRDNSHLTILAKNYNGYKNLMKLSSDAAIEGFYYKPRVDFEILEKYHQDLIILSGCSSSELSKLIKDNQFSEAQKLIKKYISIFGPNFYLEIQRFPGSSLNEKINQQLISYSKQYNINLVATNDVHYLNKEDAYIQEILLCIQTQQTIHEKRQLSMIDIPEFYLKNQSEMKGLFLDVPEAIDNTVAIASQCQIEIPYGKWILPIYETPENLPPHQYLRDLVFTKAGNRVTVDQKVIDRLNYELSIIEKKGYSTYFLVVSDFVNWAKEKHIAVGPGRGSAAGSMVAYVLNITDINPLDYSLPFERFLNPDRPTPPDFDIDFADARRDEVLAYVTDKYGTDKVAQIITFGRMEARLAVRDVNRALGFSYSQGDRIAKMIPIGKQGFEMTIDKALVESPNLKYAYDNENDTKKILDAARQLEGIARHSSVHAAGVVISDKPLTEYVPLTRESKADRIITQYDMYALDLNAVSGNKALGLLKMDFLGLRNLSIIEKAIDFIKINQNKLIDIHNIPLDDQKTFSLISEGKTVGVFQLESRGMRALAKDLKPNKLSDIAAMVALYRPGPMSLIPIFLEGKKNLKKIKYLHKDLAPILGETYGVLVYQEQVMEIAHKIAGFTMSEADNLRMAMGKKKKSMMIKEKNKFVTRCITKGYSNSLADRIFSFIEKFVGYGFNKPHSASYGLIAYWTAYLKANYPIEYMTALLSAELKGSAGSEKEAKIFAAIEETKSLGIKILGPDINKSLFNFSIEVDEDNNKAIRFGLTIVKNVGSSAIESILQARLKNDFTSLKDFLTRVDLRKVNKKTVESLIKAGAFDKFGHRAALLIYYPKVVEEIISQKKKTETGQDNLFATQESDNDSDELPTTSQFTDNEIIQLEKEILGFSFSKNPLKQYQPIIDKKITSKIGELSSNDISKIHIIAGNISAVRVIVTKKNNHTMAFVMIFDATGSIELTVFPRTYNETRSVWKTNTPVLVKGRVEEREGILSMIVDQAIDLSRIT